MKTKLTLFLLALFSLAPIQAQGVANTTYGEMDTYQRSSLYIVLLSHNKNKYADEIRNAFFSMPLPIRYNNHNLDIRVFDVKSSLSNKDVCKLLEKEEVAKQLVAKWFDRDPNTGMMDMDLIHQRGGYNATYSDLKKAQSTERGISALPEEGIEMIRNTFVLVCDIDYYDREKTGKAVSIISGLASAYFQYSAQEQARKGNMTAAYNNAALSSATAATSVVAADIGGFAVSLNAHLLKLDWNNDLTKKMYREYWVDSATSEAEKVARKQRFDQDKSSFKLSYIGDYTTYSSKTVLKSQSDLSNVMTDVCGRTVNSSIVELAKNFPVFKPKTGYQCENGNIKAYIGKKEGLSYGSKYEILECVKKGKDEFKYKRIGVVRPTGTIWNNSVGTIDQSDLQGTTFHQVKGNDICQPGLVMREMGKSGFQYKRNVFTVDLFTGVYKFKQEDMEKNMTYDNRKYNNSLSHYSCYDFKLESNTYLGFDAGWTVNYNTYLGWNVFNFQAHFSNGGNGGGMVATSGLFIRTSPIQKKGHFSFFAFPSIGAYYTSVPFSYIETSRYYDGSGHTELKDGEEIEASGLYYNLGLGLNITSKLFISYSMNSISNSAFGIGYHF